MVPAPEGREWFTVPQVARILSLHKQSVYDAVWDGRMEARGSGRERRVHAREIIRYAIRTDRDVDAIVGLMQEIGGEIDIKKIIGWALAAIGLYYLLKKLE